MKKRGLLPITQRFMRHLTIACSLAFLAIHAKADAGCVDQQKADGNLPGLTNATVRAIACNQSDMNGDISIDVYLNGKHATTLRTSYESPAYVLSLDTSIRFGEGTTQGLGVSTGKGRDGTGMHYWKIPKTGAPTVDLGDAPTLEPDDFMPGTFSTLVSSTGKYQAVRYFYEIKHDRLVVTKAVGFSLSNPQTYVSTLMAVALSGESVIKRRRTLSVEKANMCMAGKIACW
ncbi:hypothetical protein PQQ52_05865 [Paraburkholderia sediminicola]|uniref:hypothetical protein n=1 Tax=Paraburkholderia sediminicola TaxID=458836 RepID=UPI0038BA0A43